jgi:type I restriction enzyme M protein
MLTDPKLRSQVDQLWNKLWTGGLSNPIDAIEQFSYLLFLKRLDDAENARERQAQRLNRPYASRMPDEMRWRTWTQFEAGKMLDHLKTVVFPWFRRLGNREDAGAAPAELNSFAEYMQTAECKINRASLLVEACKAIDQMQISAQNQDVQGDLYEYLLSKLNTAGRNGQFRTPRHIIRMMVQMADPKPGDRIADLAAGTCGFLVNAYQHILEQHTSRGVLSYDDEGQPHNLIGDQLTEAQRQFLQTEALRGYDNDSGMTMLRIGSMNLMLHGIEHPRFFYKDTLSKEFNEEREYSLILMNPPFKGAVDKGEVHAKLPSNTAKSELLFLHLILRALDMGGRCAVIVPDGVLFGSNKAHVDIRKKLIEENRLDGVVSMPGGVFKPYAGVSTAVLLFTRGGSTDRIWFYDMDHDGFSLDDKRLPVPENDIPDILTCWLKRKDVKFEAARAARLTMLSKEAAPLKAQRLRWQADVHRLQFERTIAPEGDTAAQAALDTAQRCLDEVEHTLAPLQREMGQLSRQFWVSKAEVAARKYDLSASRYRQAAQDVPYFAPPSETLARLRKLEQVIGSEVDDLYGLLK